MSPLAVLAVTSAATSSVEMSPLAVLTSACADGPVDLDVGRRRGHGDVAALGHLDPHRHRVAAQEAHAVQARDLHRHHVAGPRRPALDGGPLDELLRPRRVGLERDDGGAVRAGR